MFFNLQAVGAFDTGGGVDVTDHQVTFTLEAKPDFQISNVSIQENGDFSLLGVGTDITKVGVGLAAIMRIYEVDGQAITPIVVSKNMTFSPASTPNGQYALPDFEGAAQPWSGNLLFDVNSILAGAGIQGHATQLDLTFDNSLFAVSETGSAALIMKKMVDIGVNSDGGPNVPEPSTLVMLGIGAMSLAGYRRRRRMVEV